MSLIHASQIEGYQQRPIKVLQFGTGVFLRGFFDWMLNRMNDSGTFNGSAAVVKLTERGDMSSFEQQGGVFQHITRGVADGATVNQLECITCVQKWVHPYPQWQEYLALASEPELAVVVSNSTEAGIRYQQCDKPQQCPDSFPAKLCALLFARFEQGLGGLWIIPCELIEDNGTTLLGIVKQHAQDWSLGDAFVQWLASENHFVDTLVDRIVSAPSPEERAQLIADGACQEDNLLNASEPYHVLVLDADESLEDVLPMKSSGLSVVYTQDLDAYRERKVKLLNGAHTSMLFLSYLKGNNTVEESLADESIAAFLDGCLRNEVIPTIQMDKQELNDFADAVLERFRNPFLKHQLLSISLNSISKIQHRVLRTLRDYVEQYQELPRRLCAAFASFMYFYYGQWQGDEYQGRRGDEQYQIQDDPASLKELADWWASVDEADNLSSALDELLSRSALWGSDLTQVAGFKQQVLDDLTSLQEQGPQHFVEQLVSGLANNSSAS